MSELVTSKWLYSNLQNEKVVIFDCSWYMPNENRKPQEEYKKEHISGSYFFNINKISNKSSKFPHMLPSLKYFINMTKNFNIHNDTTIITYAKENLLGASRVWWMFKYFGFENIKVLNGNLLEWKKEKKEITKKYSKKYKSTFNFKKNNNLLENYKNILKNYKKSNYLIYDARNKDRFNGLIKEPRKGLRSGHIPNSKNLFWKKLIKKNGALKNKNLIEKTFNFYNNKNKKIVISCGSGISACVLSLSLKHVFDINSSVYDGSWTEWGNKKNLPISK
tara:strand:- start:594 stop:1424 length:831 start_codon:yes stop_codon:yes gene_type:complete